MNRRDFLKAAVAAGIVAGLPSASHAAAGSAYKTKLEKALIAQVADDATCERIVKAGFSGVELTKKGVTVKQAIEGRRTAEKHGLRIHSLMSGGADFNNPDPDARQRSLDVMTERIQVAAAYGASTMLLVPCRVNGQMPAPTQFSIDYDPQTLHVRTVAKGDNAPFSAYIDAQNRSTDLTREFVEKLIPVAAREGVIIALENVWNNLWVTPEFAAALVKSFDSPWIRAYVDLGNHVRYTAPERWLRTMGPLTVKLHIKDFRIDRSMKNDGEFVALGRGSVNWKSVRDVIDEVRYNGWVTIEENGYSDAEYSAIMDRFFAGQALTGGSPS